MMFTEVETKELEIAKNSYVQLDKRERTTIDNLWKSLSSAKLRYAFQTIALSAKDLETVFAISRHATQYLQTPTF